DPVRAGELVQDLFRVDAQHPALVHLASALVGAPDPGLVRPGWKDLRGDDRDGGDDGGGEALRSPGRARPRSRCPRYLVLLRAVAVRDDRLAGADPGAGPLLSGRRAGDRV